MIQNRRQLFKWLGVGAATLATATGSAGAKPPSNPGGGGDGGNDTTDPTSDSLDVSADDSTDTVTFTYDVSDNQGLNEVGYYVESDKGNRIVNSGTEHVDSTSASGSLRQVLWTRKKYDWRFYIKDDANNRTYQTGEVTV